MGDHGFINVTLGNPWFAPFALKLGQYEFEKCVCEFVVNNIFRKSTSISTDDFAITLRSWQP